MQEQNWTVSFTFRGVSVSVTQERRVRSGLIGSKASIEDITDEDNTGWQCWECSNVLLRYGGRADVLEGHLRGIIDKPDLPNLKVLDMSAGAGLIALACGALGAQVVASEIESQIPHLQRNIHRAGLEDKISTQKYYWGDDARRLIPSFVSESFSIPQPYYNVAFVSDIIYIALRDGLARPLAITLAGLTQISDVVYFAFEERLIREETEFMEALTVEGDRLKNLSGRQVITEERKQEIESHVDKNCPTSCACALDAYAPGGFQVQEIFGPDTVLKQEDALVGVAGVFDTIVGDLFWEPPPIRIFVLKRS